MVKMKTVQKVHFFVQGELFWSIKRMLFMGMLLP